MSDIEERRNHIVKGCLGWPIRVLRRFTPEEVETRTAAGVATPLDLMPRDFWWQEGQQFPRFSEEMLGADF